MKTKQKQKQKIKNNNKKITKTMVVIGQLVGLDHLSGVFQP